MRTPDFSQFQKVLERKRPERPTLFEFFLNASLHTKLSGIPVEAQGRWGSSAWCAAAGRAYAAAGYDYATTTASDFNFVAGEHGQEKSISQNEGAVIRDRESFNRYQWMDPAAADYSRLANVGSLLPQGMKAVVFGPGGVLENAIKLCGYENLAMMVLDDPALVGDIFDAIGSRMVEYYRIAGKHKNVGAMISNDDWGFAQQTMFAPEDMRKFVFPWHVKIVKTIHEAGVPAILHSCGNLSAVMDDIIDVIKYDAKHSYEDKIMPVEEAYVKYGSRIAILGGIDVDFVCRSTPAQILDRSRNMLRLADAKGGYALGTGNSVPEYVPQDHYLAMIRAANPGARFVA